jgi:hypothetical protein
LFSPSSFELFETKTGSQGLGTEPHGKENARCIALSCDALPNSWTTLS